MTAIIKDFDEIWLHPTPEGMAFSSGADEQVASVYVRVIVDARSREDWEIEEVHMITFGFERDENGNRSRSKEYVNVLEGKFLRQAQAFFSGPNQYSDLLQDAVNLEILESGQVVG